MEIAFTVLIWVLAILLGSLTMAIVFVVGLLIVHVIGTIGDKE